MNKIFYVLIIVWCVLTGFYIYDNLNKEPVNVPTPAPTIIVEQEQIPTEVTIPEPIESTEPSLDSIRVNGFEEKWHESAVYMAKTLWGEARGCSVAEQQKVAWCILNRVDDPRFPKTIIGVITAPGQFHGYSPNFPCTYELYELSMDVIAQWQLEKAGGISDRNLDPGYLYFCADESGVGNIFRKEW